MVHSNAAKEIQETVDRIKNISEYTSDNGDEEGERIIGIRNAILGGEGVEYEKLDVEQLLAALIDFSRKDNNNMSGQIAKAIAPLLRRVQ